MNETQLETAYLASGCFWGTQYYLQRLNGVEATYVGYMGGTLEQPSYEQVKTGDTGHVETVMVLFDPRKISYSHLLRYYFETHDFSQVGGQGPDIGTQYRSVVFYCNDFQQLLAAETIELLSEMGYLVATGIEEASVFWIAENYHQDYYNKTNGAPYCHRYRKIF